MKNTRIHTLKHKPIQKGPILYWMSRDQRSQDNAALLYAQELALKQKAPLIVLFCLVPEFLGATIRQYGFMLKGLRVLEQSLKELNITFHLSTGHPASTIPEFCQANKAAALITDFDPLRIKQTWQQNVLCKIDIPFYEVDAHNIVPCRLASTKQEYAARTIRPKIHKHLPEYLVELPEIQIHPYDSTTEKNPIDWVKLPDILKIDHSIKEVNWLEPGEKAARKMLDTFIKTKIDLYNTDRNDPANDALSNLSPYLHFGQIAAQRVALEVSNANANQEAIDSFLEELIVRRELSDNYCFYNPDYDNLTKIPVWARKTLDEHRNDLRTYVYSLEELEKAKTHDEAWNAAQIQMIESGKMHGYMRMYWAKKILEWTQSPEQALEYSIYLNDKYELDGRDPNGYTGIMWSIAGIHDRAWQERPIFGKIRYMSYNGLKSKFNINAYINKWTS
jgi:deoxyribodipyrimidine photo-lyase